MSNGITLPLSKTVPPGRNSEIFLASMSPDGRFYAYTDETYSYIYDRVTDKTVEIGLAADGSRGNGDTDGIRISADGNHVAIEAESTNWSPAIPASDGDKYGDLGRIYVTDRDPRTGKWSVPVLVSRANDGTRPDRGSVVDAISSDGRFVVFDSYATTLVAGDTNNTQDVFVRRRW